MRDDASVGCHNGHQNYEYGARQQLAEARFFKPESGRRKPHERGKNTDVMIRAEHSQSRWLSPRQMLLW